MPHFSSALCCTPAPHDPAEQGPGQDRPGEHGEVGQATLPKPFVSENGVPAIGKPSVRPPVPNGGQSDGAQGRSPGRFLVSAGDTDGFGSNRRQPARFGRGSQRGGSR